MLEVDQEKIAEQILDTAPGTGPVDTIWLLRTIIRQAESSNNPSLGFPLLNLSAEGIWDKRCSKVILELDEPIKASTELRPALRDDLFNFLQRARLPLPKGTIRINGQSYTMTSANLNSNRNYGTYDLSYLSTHALLEARGLTTSEQEYKGEYRYTGISQGKMVIPPQVVNAAYALFKLHWQG